MKRILIFHPYLAPYRIDLYNRLNIEFKTKVLLTGSQSELDTLGYCLEAVNKKAHFSFQYYTKGIYIGRHLLSSIFCKTIKSFKPDIVLAHEYGLNTLFAIWMRVFLRFKLYVTCDDSPLLAKSYSKKRRILRNFIVRHVDGLIVVNPLTASYLKAIYRMTYCQFVYFPIIQDDKVLYDNIISSKDLANQYVEQYGLENKKIMLYVGRFVDVKNIELIVNAYSKVCSEENKLVLIGDGALKSSIGKQIRDLSINENVIMLDSKTGMELYAWYYLSHYFVLGSKQEPFGAVVNEALVAGCKCIVSDAAGASCLINSRNGLVFQSQNKQALVDCMLKLFNEPIAKKTITNMMPHSFEEYYRNLKTDIGL